MGNLLLAADHRHSRYADSVQLTEEQMQAAKFGDVYTQNPEKAFVDLGEFIAFSAQNSGTAELSSLMAQYAKTAREKMRSFFQSFLQIFIKIQMIEVKTRPSETVFQTAF